MTDYLFEVNLYTYALLFFLFFFSANTNDVIFGVNYSKENRNACELIKAFRSFCFKTTLSFFSVSLILSELFKSTFYFGILSALYISLMLIKYLSCLREVKKLTLSDNKNEKGEDRFIFLDSFDLAFSIFLSLYDFYLIYTFKSELINFDSSLYIIPVTLTFFNILVFAVIKLILSGSDFFVKKVKAHIINILCITSYFVSIITVFYTLFIVKDFNFTHLANAVVMAVLGIFTLWIYIKFTLNLNKPRDFNILNEKVSGTKLIESNLKGTRLFINFKNKKSYLLVTGFLMAFLVYLLLIYLFTI